MGEAGFQGQIRIRIEVHMGDKILEAEEEYQGEQTFINLVAAAKRGIELQSS